jgi:hypothetical protein
MASPELIAAMDKHQASLGRHSVEVPEWGITIHYSPLTLAEQAVLHGWKSRPANDELLIYAKIIVMKAEDDTGKKLFTQKDYDLLKDKDYDLLSGIALKLMNIPEVEDLKN